MKRTRRWSWTDKDKRRNQAHGVNWKNPPRWYMTFVRRQTRARDKMALQAELRGYSEIQYSLSTGRHNAHWMYW